MRRTGAKAGRREGRPTKYLRQRHPQRAYELAVKGLTSAEIAGELDVALSTLKAWQEEHSEFSAAIKAGKDAADERVEKALYKRALGYSVKERKDVYARPEPDTSEQPSLLEEPEQEMEMGLSDLARPELVRSEITSKQVVPDVSAQIFWLKNRQPENWRDKQQQEHSGTVRQEHGVAGMSDEELRAILAGKLRGETEPKLSDRRQAPVLRSGSKTRKGKRA